MKNIRLGDVLIEFGYITPDQLNTALAYQKEHREPARRPGFAGAWLRQ